MAKFPLPVEIDATEFVGLRISLALLRRIDGWADQQKIGKRSEAIRRLIEFGFGSPQLANRPRDSKAKAKAKASDMAGKEIDRVNDRSATTEERASRKRRLLKGPKEFRDLRGNPKAKG